MLKLHVMFKATLFLIIAVSQSVQARTETLQFTPAEVADGVYSIVSPYYGRPTPDNQGWNSNSHFVVTEAGVLVFDTGSSTDIGSALLSAIKTVTDQPVRWVVNSHSHADHWLGNAPFAQAGAEILATPDAITTMKAEGEMDVNAFLRMTDGKTGDTQLMYPQRTIEQSQTLSFGGVDVQFILSESGHSPGDMLIWLPQQKVIIGGDILSSQWMPIMTPRGSIPDLLATLSQVIDLEPNAVLTGHGNITDVSSVVRDVNFLSAVWAIVQNGNRDNATVETILSEVHIKVAEMFKHDYLDFDTSIGYLVEMMYQKQ